MTISRGIAKLVEMGALKATARSKAGMKTSKMYRIMVKDQLPTFIGNDDIPFE
jgi:hypothetical protein